MVSKAAPNVEARLGSDGALSAQLTERDRGEAAANARRRFIHESRPDYTKRIEQWVSRSAGGAAVSKVEPKDGPVSNEFGLVVDFSAAHYGQVMQDRLLVFKPAVVSRLDGWGFRELSRKYPIILDSESYVGTIRVRLSSVL